MNKPSIILIAPNDVGLGDLIAKNLQHHDFDVIYVKKEPFVYQNYGEKLINLLRKTLWQDRHYKVRKQNKILMNQLKAMIDARADNIDYALIIRPDLLCDDYLHYLSTVCNQLIGYQWDGLSVFPQVLDKIHFFDDFFVFDDSDVGKYPTYSLKAITNFYFDFDFEVVNPTKNASQRTKQAYFVGNHIDNRVDAMNTLLASLFVLGVEVECYIAGIAHKAEKQKLYQKDAVIFLPDDMSFMDNLSHVKQTDIVIDFVNNLHFGLSFRFFEALHYQKKLISNNPTVVQYDFYHANNIFIWQDVIDQDKLACFLQAPYVPLPEAIVQKYAFGNWINYVLDRQPHIPLTHNQHTINQHTINKDNT